MNYPQIASRAFGKPLLIEPTRGHQILTSLASLIATNAESRAESAKELDFEARKSRATGDWDTVLNADYPAYYRRDGVAYVPIHGILVHRNGVTGSYCGMTGYDGIKTTLSMIAADSSITTIIGEFDTPGGEVSGIIDVAKAIKALPHRKIAIVDDLSASAGYWLASQFDEIICTETGESGSVGVVIAHKEMSKALEMSGVTVNMIYSGDRKVDGNPYEALPKAVRERLQKEVHNLRNTFANAVAAGRGLSVEQVLATEADVYRGAQGIDVGFVDRVMTAADAVMYVFDSQRKTVSLTAHPVGNKGAFMSEANAPRSEQAGITPEAHEAAIAAAREQGSKEGRQAERAEIAAAFSSEAFSGREAAIVEMLSDPEMASMPAASIVKVAAKFPAEKPLADKSQYAKTLAAVEAIGGAGVSANAEKTPRFEFNAKGSDDADTEDAKLAAQMALDAVRSANKATA